MILIAHRGNMDGPNPSEENKPYYIQNTLDLGFDVELDVWLNNDAFMLGHDKPMWTVNVDFLLKNGLWCHAKNIECFYRLLRISEINCFFHDKDEATLTSYGYIWTLPGKKLTPKSICVLPEKYMTDDLNQNISGICSDYIKNYENDRKKTS